MNKRISFLILVVAIVFSSVKAQSYPWYTQGRFAPSQRLEFKITNPLNRPVTNASVIIFRENFPMPDLHEMWITIVDPAGEPRPEPNDSAP